MRDREGAAGSDAFDHHEEDEMDDNNNNHHHRRRYSLLMTTVSAPPNKSSSSNSKNSQHVISAAPSPPTPPAAAAAAAAPTAHATSSHYYLRHVPSCLRLEQAPLEATGLAVDIFARATVLMSSLFLGPALLELATRAAMELACGGSDGDDNDNSNKACAEDARIYGFRPSSLLSNIAIFSGLFSSLLLPLFGALVDHTPYRKQVGGYAAACIVVVKTIEIMVGKHTWFPVACLQVLSGTVVSFHTTATYAYTSELSQDAAIQAHYNTTFYVIMFCASILFIAVVLIPSQIFQLHDVATARLSQSVTSITGTVLFSFAWTYLFRHCPAKSRVPDGMSIWTAGFQKNLRTLHRIRSRFPALIWLLTGVAFAEAATAALVTIATTYLKDVLDMDSNEIGLVFLAVLICGIPGSRMAGYLASTLRWNPIHNIFLCYALFTATTCAAVMFMTKPEEKNRAYWFGGLWGIGLGWLHPIHTSAYISLVEKGQEAEMMGIFLLVCNVLSWLPPLTFTILNEAGFPMSLGMGSLNLYFVIAFCSLLAMGKYEDALEALYVATEEQVELKDHAVI